MLPPSVASVIGAGGHQIPTRSDTRSESNLCTHVPQSHKIAFPVLSPEARNEVSGEGESTKDGFQREVPSHISTCSSSKASASESEVLVFPLRGMHLSEPTPNVHNINSDPSTSNEGAPRSSSQSWRRAPGLSQSNTNSITRCSPSPYPLISPKVRANSAGATTASQPGLARLAPIKSATLDCKLPDPANSFETPAKPRMPCNLSSPTTTNLDFEQISTATNWVRTGLERRSSGSSPLASSVHFPSRSRTGSYGESGSETLRMRERRWGSGLSIPRPSSYRGTEESTQRTYSIDRSSSERGFARIPSHGANRRLSASNSLSSSMRASSCSRSRATSGGESDIEILKERERRWGSGLPIPKPPIPGRSESATNRRLSLDHRSTRSNVEQNSTERTEKTNIKSNLDINTVLVGLVPKGKIGDDRQLTTLDLSVPTTLFQQKSISSIAESPSASLHSAWTNLPLLGPVTSPLGTSPIPGVVPSVHSDMPGSDDSLTSPVLPFSGGDSHVAGETLSHDSANKDDSAASGDSLGPCGTIPDEIVITSPVTINREMSIPEVLEHLGRHGCNDVTNQLDISKSSEHPVSSGGFGDVYRGSCHNGNQVAIKCLRLYVDSTDITKKLLKRAARELYVWSKCSHPNVLTLIGVAQYRSQIAMVSPWMEYNNLKRLLSLHPKVDRYMLCLQIADGVAHLHKEGVIHGDLKGDNILFEDNFTPKLTDFGNAALKEYTLKFSRTTGMAGVSLNWAAPEVLREESELSFETDVWSLGMTMLEVITGEIPYAELRSVVVLMRLVSYILPARPGKHMPLQVKHADIMWSLLAECWEKTPGDRPSPIEVRNRMSMIIVERDRSDRSA